MLNVKKMGIAQKNAAIKCQSAYKQSMQIYLFNKLTKTKQKKKQSKLSEQREEILIFYI